MPAIAAKYGVTTGAVAYRLRMWGLTARDTGMKHSPGPKRRFRPSKEELAALYRKMSMREVAAHYGVGETVIFTRLRDYGIKVRSLSESLTGKPKSLSHRLAMSKALLGKKLGAANHNWRGGVTSQNHRARSRTAYHEWKAAVLRRANYRCANCGLEHGKICRHCGHRVSLHAHHVKHFAKHPLLRYEPKNGRALCDRCHSEQHF